MSQTHQHLFSQYNYELSNVKLGTFIRESKPDQTVASPKYGISIFLIVTGILSAIIWSALGLLLLIVGVIRVSYFWYKYLGFASKKPSIFSILITAEEVHLSRDFRVQRLFRNEVKDISIRLRSEYGEREAQFFFTDDKGVHYESIVLHGTPGDNLKINANHIADYLWDLVRTNEV